MGYIRTFASMQGWKGSRDETQVKASGKRDSKNIYIPHAQTRKTQKQITTTPCPNPNLGHHSLVLALLLREFEAHFFPRGDQIEGWGQHISAPKVVSRFRGGFSDGEHRRRGSEERMADGENKRKEREEREERRRKKRSTYPRIEAPTAPVKESTTPRSVKVIAMTVEAPHSTTVTR